MNRIDLGQNRDRWHGRVNAVTKIVTSLIGSTYQRKICENFHVLRAQKKNSGRR